MADLEIFRRVRFFDPSRALTLNTQAADIDALAASLPAIQPHVAGMKAELPQYLALAVGFHTNRQSVDDFTRDVLHFWRTHGREIPALCQGARIVFALTPSSAASERVFSLMNCLFNCRQDATLADQLLASLMIRYNGRVDANEVD